MTLKFLGERGTYKKIKKARKLRHHWIIKSSSLHLNTSKNALYQLRFMQSLKKKARTKHAPKPKFMNLKKFKNTYTIYDFDNLITAPVHGLNMLKITKKNTTPKIF